MTLRILVCALSAGLVWAASNPVAARLAREARDAQKSGQLVRAYLLYEAAAARDPQNPTYRADRDALAPIAKLLTKADVQNADVSAEIKAAETEPPNAEPPIELASLSAWQRDENLQPLPHLLPKTSPATFDLRGDEKSLFQQVAAFYGIRPIFDPQLDVRNDIHFHIDQADFRTVMEALTAVTHTFVFPISQHEFFVARDTELKRNELEPNVLLTFPLPNALDQKDLLEAANAVRSVLNLRAVGWDSANRTVMIRDRYTRARIARSLLDALLLPKAQVSFEVQFLAFDSDRSYHYGLSMQTSFQIVGSPATLASLGTPLNLFALGLTNATLFANYSKAVSRNYFDATVVVDDGQTANFHVGDKYPIPQAIFTGFAQTGGSALYNPLGQVTLEDLGLILKMTPHVDGAGNISLDLEAGYKALGAQTFNTIPSVLQRQFKGSVILREGEWAVIAGMDSSMHNASLNGLDGISQIPGLNQVLSENTRETQISNTLIVIKPTITRLPMSSAISPQYLLGPVRGDRVLF